MQHVTEGTHLLVFHPKIRVLQLKSEVHATKCYEGTEALVEGEWVTPHPGQFTPCNDPVPTVEGWVGPMEGLDGCGKTCLHRGSISEPSSP